MKYIVVILARGGSKRVPGKNIKPLLGKPLIAYSIMYAKQNIPNAEVWVSTDSEETKEISLSYGAKVIDRPDTLCDDNATSAAALQHAALYFKEEGIDYDYMVQLQVTNPLRPKGMMEEALKVIEEKKPSALVCFSPIVKKMGRIVDDEFQPWNYSFGQRSQDMETLYYENGLLYVVTRAHIENGVLFAPGAYPLVLDHIYGGIDIDTEEDFIKAEYYAQLEGHS